MTAELTFGDSATVKLHNASLRHGTWLYWKRQYLESCNFEVGFTHTIALTDAR